MEALEKRHKLTSFETIKPLLYFDTANIHKGERT